MERWTRKGSRVFFEPKNDMGAVIDVGTPERAAEIVTNQEARDELVSMMLAIKELLSRGDSSTPLSIATNAVIKYGRAK